MTRVIFPGYYEYIGSEAWKEKRQQRLELDGRECTQCDRSTRLEVHHLTYERLGNERLEDLITMCNECHARVHGRSPSVLRPAGPSVAEFTRRARAREASEHWHKVLAAAVHAHRAVAEFQRLLARWGEDHPYGDEFQRIERLLGMVVENEAVKRDPKRQAA